MVFNICLQIAACPNPHVPALLGLPIVDQGLEPKQRARVSMFSNAPDGEKKHFLLQVGLIRYKRQRRCVKPYIIKDMPFI